MKTAAIICEYNPFHNGHLTQINLIKKELKADDIKEFLMKFNELKSLLPKKNKESKVVTNTIEISTDDFARLAEMANRLTENHPYLKELDE